MIIRKNLSTPLKQHQLLRLTQQQQQNQSHSHISQQNPHYRTFDAQDLVEKIKEQQGQIQKLLSIIDKYKSKIEEFQQYEEVIKEFLARKSQQKSIDQQLKQPKLIVMSTVSQTSNISPQPCKKPKKQLILPSYSITILCQNQKIKCQKTPLIQFQTPQKTSAFPMDSRSHKDEDKQNRQYRTNYKQKSFRQPFYRGSKSFSKQNSLFDINKSIPFLDQSEYREELNRRNMIQRVPSLNNMRRIQKCFKLLKS